MTRWEVFLMILLFIVLSPYIIACEAIEYIEKKTKCV